MERRVLCSGNSGERRTVSVGLHYKRAHVSANSIAFGGADSESIYVVAVVRANGGADASARCDGGLQSNYERIRGLLDERGDHDSIYRDRCECGTRRQSG